MLLFLPDCTVLCPFNFLRFLIDAHWFEQCKKYLGLGNGGGVGEDGGDETIAAAEESANPGLIDNGPLIKAEEPSEIRDQRQ